MIGPNQYQKFEASKKNEETLGLLRAFWSVDEIIKRHGTIRDFCRNHNIDVPEVPVEHLDLDSGYPPFRTFWSAVVSILNKMRL